MERTGGSTMVGLLTLVLFCVIQEWLWSAPSAVPGEPLYAFWNFAIPMALGIGRSLINRGDNKRSTRQPAMSAGAEDITRGRAAEDEYYDRISNFDATEGAKARADVLSQDWMRDFTEGVEGLRGNQVSRGRLDTGYGMEDEDRYVRDARRSMTDSLAALSMDAQRMDFDAAREIGSYGERRTGRGIDQRQTEEDRRRADAASKRSMWGNIGGALINAGGQYLGNRGR